MNSSVSCHELRVPPLPSYDCVHKHLAPLVLRVSLQRGNKKKIKYTDYFITQDAKFEKLHGKIKEVFESYCFFHSLPCSV